MGMIMIRPTLLALLLAALNVNAFPAEAITRQNMLSLIRQAGVTVSRRSSCGSNGQAAAHYEPGNNAICIAESQYRDMRHWDQALTHEAMHMVQDCMAGLHNSSMMTLAHNVRYRRDVVSYIRRRGSNWVAFIKRHYRPSDYAIELEAYALQDRPEDVARLIKQKCLS